MTKEKSNKVIKATMATLVTTLVVGSNSAISLQAVNNDNSDTAILNENSVTSPIIISEIVADSHQSDMTTTSGRDAFEYFELYNTSNQSINLDDYQVLYDNGSTISEWNLPANTILPANEALIVWIQNEESKDLDLALFREYYNLSADEGQIVKTENIVSGFSNSGQRELRVTVKNTKQILSSVIYNDEDVKVQTKKELTLFTILVEFKKVLLVMTWILHQVV
ncbi:MAG: lamin tail domain-containing protein [Thomasclavelia ramosa]